MTATDATIALAAPGVEVELAALGARLARLRTPDRDGVPADIVLGPQRGDYLADRSYLGATVGRYANRIAAGTFELDGQRNTVPCNENGAALHGGPDGFDRHSFRAEPGGRQSVAFHRTSPDGENGFPGTLDVTVTYTVRAGELHIEHTARTDRPTVVNLTNHAYYNLTGRSGTVEHHRLRVPAGRFLPVDDRLIPTGELAPVDGTPFDFRAAARLGARLRDGHPQLRVARGYDHTLVLDGWTSGELTLAAAVEEPASGRTMTMYTDQPGVQLYSGNSWTARSSPAGARAYARATPSAWSRSTSRTRRTGPTSPPRCCDRETTTARGSCCASEWPDPAAG